MMTTWDVMQWGKLYAMNNCRPGDTILCPDRNTYNEVTNTLNRAGKGGVIVTYVESERQWPEKIWPSPPEPKEKSFTLE